jgi:hypothetical protein
MGVAQSTTNKERGNGRRVATSVPPEGGNEQEIAI